MLLLSALQKKPPSHHVPLMRKRATLLARLILVVLVALLGISPCKYLSPDKLEFELISHSVTNKISTHACEAAGQQIAGSGSDTAVNLLISNVGVLNANTDAAGLTSRSCWADTDGESICA